MGKMENGLSLGIAMPRLSIKEQVFQPTVDLYLTVGVIALFSLLYLMLLFAIESFLVTLEGIVRTDFGKPFNVLFR
jgi:ABC-type nitrate/sulfonate/bicarbonate transport system permease component